MLPFFRLSVCFVFWFLVATPLDSKQKIRQRQQSSSTDIIQLTLVQIATQILQSNEAFKEEVVTQSSWDDLQLERLMQKVDKHALTSFGPWGIRFQSRPVVGQSLQHRVAAARELFTQPELFVQLRKEMATIAKAEKSLLNFWDPAQQSDPKLGQMGHLDRAQGLYYNSLKAFNNNSLTLEARMALLHARDLSLLIASWGVFRTAAMLARTVSRRQLPAVGATLQDIYRDNVHFFSRKKSPEFLAASAQLDDVMRHMPEMVWARILGNTERVQELERLQIEGQQGINDFLRQDEHELRAIERESDEYIATQGWNPLSAQGLGVKVLGGLEKFAVGVTFGAAITNRKFTMGEWNHLIAQEYKRSHYGRPMNPVLHFALCAFYRGLLSIVAIVGTKTFGGWIFSREKILRSLQVELVDVAKILHCAQRISLCGEQYPALNTQEAFVQLRYYTQNKETEGKIRKLLSLLNSRTFTTSNPVLFTRGRVLCAYQLLKEIKHELVPLMAALAKIDGMLAINSFAREHTNKEATFGVPVFIPKGESPIVHAKALWLPLIDAHQAVVNDIYLGKNHPKAGIITGPNGTGKSAIMKALAYSVVLAQGWGLVPAQEIQLTEIDHIETYIDPQEDVSQGLSTFMAQKTRADRILARLHNAPSTKSFLILIDEPFSGTVEQQASGLAASLAHDIGSDPRTLLMLATHFEAPTNLAATNKLFANYQLLVEIDPITKLPIRRFCLLPGSATWWFDTSPAAREKQKLYIENLV